MSKTLIATFAAAVLLAAPVAAFATDHSKGTSHTGKSGTCAKTCASCECAGQPECKCGNCACTHDKSAKNTTHSGSKKSTVAHEKTGAHGKSGHGEGHAANSGTTVK